MGTKRINRIIGRNAVDSMLDPRFKDFAVEALNVDRSRGLVANRRSGHSLLSTTGGTAFNVVHAMTRFVPGVNEAAAELFGFDSNGTLVKRLAGGTSWADVTASDTNTAPVNTMGAPLGGSQFLAYDSAVDRLHVYDPSLAKIRRVGLAQPAAPTVANTGAGAYAAVLRYYRVRYAHMSGSTVIRRSEASTATSFTPSGAGTAARVTKPASISEDETHWEIEVSLDNANWYRLASVVVGTTTYDDSAATTTYSTNTLSDPAGFYTLPPSCRSVVSDGNRLVMAGPYENGRVARYYWTPVVGSADKGDAERIVVTTYQRSYGDLGENDKDGKFVGLSEPTSTGIIFAFKYRAVWQLSPTGDVLSPYSQRKVMPTVGSVHQKMIVSGQNRGGQSCIYFWDPDTGPWRYGPNGFQYLGRDILDIVASVNLDATTIVGHGLWHRAKRQLWFWISTGSANTPDIRMVFDPQLETFDEAGNVRGGWFKHDGVAGDAICSCVFSDTVGASMSSATKPYMGRSGGTVAKADTGSLDITDLFSAYVETRPIVAADQLGKNVGAGSATVLSKAATTSLQLHYIRDYGIESVTFTTSIAPQGSELYVARTFQGAGIEDAMVLQVRIGDNGPGSTDWTIDELVVPVTGNEDRGNV